MGKIDVSLFACFSIFAVIDSDLLETQITTKYNVPSEHQYILKPVSGTGRVSRILNFEYPTFLYCLFGNTHSIDTD
jgi:hypothetical protein